MKVKQTIGIIIYFIVALTACTFNDKRASLNLTTDTFSSEFDSTEKKVNFLKKYLKTPSPVEAAEFHIIYHDNSRGLPGPSDWDIQAVVKVPPSQVEPWIKEMQLQNDNTDFAWGQALIPKGNPIWDIKSKPKIYKRTNENVTVAVFLPEGIIFKRANSL